LLICSLQHEKYFRGINLSNIKTKLKDKKIRRKGREDTEKSVHLMYSPQKTLKNLIIKMK
jgi:hypothetical protein